MPERVSDPSGMWTVRAIGPDRWRRLALAFVALSYALAAPVVAVLECRYSLVSDRLDVPQDVVLLAAAVQLCCSVAILFRRTANVALAGLTVISVMAAAAHFEVGSPLTAVPAIVYTAIQAWLGITLCTTCEVARD